VADAEVFAPSEGLFLVGRRPQFRQYLRETWQRRRFAFTLASYRLVGGLLRNRLGVLWLVLKPLAMATIYGVIFGGLLSSAARPTDWVPYVVSGVFIFEFFTGCVGSGSKSITSNTKLVQSLSFPRILLPISVVIEQALSMIPILLLLCIVLLVFGVPISVTWLLVIPIMLLMAVFNLGVVLILARLSVWTRDVQQMVPIANRVLFYVSSIFYQVDEVFADAPVLLTIAHLVPTYDFIALVRSVMLVDHPVSTVAAVAAPIWALLAISVGVVYFWRAEMRYGLSD